jgi:hypothetical protein
MENNRIYRPDMLYAGRKSSPALRSIQSPLTVPKIRARVPFTAAQGGGTTPSAFRLHSRSKNPFESTGNEAMGPWKIDSQTAAVDVSQHTRTRDDEFPRPLMPQRFISRESNKLSVLLVDNHVHGQQDELADQQNGRPNGMALVGWVERH